MSKVHESTSNEPRGERDLRMLGSALMKCKQDVEMYKGVIEKMYKAKKGGRKRKTRRRKHRGGAVSMEFEKPEVSNTSSSGAIQGAMHKQKAGNEETAKLNREFGQGGGGGDDVTVPQMNQAGESGNKTITGGVAQTLQGRADGEYDNDVNIKPQPDGMPGGGRRRRRKRKTKRKSRKSKKRRRKKRKTRRRRKSKRKR